jgi:glycine/D-amino acid oxidase-like deaminating enzyme
MRGMSRSADIVICGAGIAGTAAAYHLAVRHNAGRVVIVDERAPLTLTSDKGTQGYRNWWPGPDATMLRFVSRSIDLMEEASRESGNAIRMSRRGYLFATAREDQFALMRSTAEQVSSFGMGELRLHPGAREYERARDEGFESSPFGADLLQGESALRAFPYLSPQVRSGGVLHIRRAGWLSAVALGNWSLTRAIAHGAEFVRDAIVAVDTTGGKVNAVHLAGGDRIATERLVIAAGPRLHEAGRMLGLELPVVHELHAKVTFRDVLGAVPRSAPFLIWADGMRIEWSAAEREQLSASEHDRRVLDEMPGGVHVRPVDGPFGDELYLIWTYESQQRPPVWPPSFTASYAEAVVRGAASMIPAMAPYAGQTSSALVDGGYYCKTRENRPLVGPLPVAGAFVCGALSGYGVMAAHGAADLVAAHAMDARLPDYAPWFLPSRYDNADYLRMMEGWGALVGQL